MVKVEIEKNFDENKTQIRIYNIPTWVRKYKKQ